MSNWPIHVRRPEGTARRARYEAGGTTSAVTGGDHVQVRSEPVATINLLLKLSSLEEPLVMAGRVGSRTPTSASGRACATGGLIRRPLIANRHGARWQIVKPQALEAAQNRKYADMGLPHEGLLGRATVCTL